MKSCLSAALPALFALLSVRPAQAQDAASITLTLDEAIQIALANNYALRAARLDLEEASSQIRSVLSGALPDVTASSGYTRNLKEANPFAGSAAGDFFSGFNSVGWLSYNEGARTDADPATLPITLDEFFMRQEAGLRAADIVLGEASDNPFSVANQFQNSVSVEQAIMDASVIKGLEVARLLRAARSRGLERQEQLIVDQVRRAFYGTLLAQQQAEVARHSVSRTARTLGEYSRRVSQGVAPKALRLSAEVQLANLETRLMQLQNQALDALDNLKFALGIPIVQDVVLRGELAVPDDTEWMPVSAQDALVRALDRRPDLEQARLTYELQRGVLRAAHLDRLPKIFAFANFSYSGRVPDVRTFTISDPNDPFRFSQGYNDFFSKAFWQSSVNVGVRVSWTIFSGFSQNATRQLRQIELERAGLQVTRLSQGVHMEVASAMRALATAREQIASQGRNVENAELNYTFASRRLDEGVATPLEERDASDQLDQSRINYLQAAHDYLVARSTYETAVGVPLEYQTDIRLASARPLEP